jgi:hypothetical protein
MTQHKLTHADYYSYHQSRLCVCDGCGATRAKPVKGDGWTVTTNETYFVSDVMCNSCATERRFSESIQDSGMAFFRALFTAIHPSLRRTVYDSLECAISNVQPSSFPNCHEFDTLTQYALFENSSHEGKS